MQYVYRIVYLLYQPAGKRKSATACVLLALTLCGCLSTPQPERLAAVAPSEQPAADPNHAKRLLPLALDQASLLHAIAAHEQVLAAEPDHYDVLTTTANLYILLGAGYETETRAKKTAYKRALFLSGAAMMNSSAFAERIANGEPVWEAADALDESHIAALSFWTTALFYQFDECLNKNLKPFHLHWMRRAEKMLRIACALDPDWGGGQLHFAYGIYYLMPAVAGGDLEKSKASFDRAVEVGNGWLINRWGRAKYLHRRTGNRDGFESDLEWMANQDPTKSPGPVFWNVYCQRDAQSLLRQADRLF